MSDMVTRATRCVPDLSGDCYNDRWEAEMAAAERRFEAEQAAAYDADKAWKDYREARHLEG